MGGAQGGGGAWGGGACGLRGRGCPGASPAGRGSDARAQLACTVVAILLQFLYLSAVGWALLEGLHLYRRRSEPRHVDRGPMRFYHVLGWGLPAVITGEVTPPQTQPRTLSPPTPPPPAPTSPWANPLWVATPPPGAWSRPLSHPHQPGAGCGLISMHSPAPISIAPPLTVWPHPQ